MPSRIRNLHAIGVGTYRFSSSVLKVLEFAVFPKHFYISSVTFPPFYAIIDIEAGNCGTTKGWDVLSISGFPQLNLKGVEVKSPRELEVTSDCMN
jgi:hypothetical protein